MLTRFDARFNTRGTTLEVCIVEQRIADNTLVKVHDRPDYTHYDSLVTADWLNERALGYPVPHRLQLFRNNSFR